MSRSRGVAVAALTAIALAVCATGAHASPWSPGPSFGQNSIDGFGGVASSPSGVTTAVWVERDGPDAQVRAQRVAADGTLGPARALGTVIPGDAADVAVNASGAAVVAWAAPDSVLKLAQIAADGTVGPIRDVATHAVPGSVRTGIDADGDATVFWVEPAIPAAKRVVRRVFSDGGMSPAVTFATHAPDDVRGDVAVAADGTSYLIWLGLGSDFGDDTAWVARIDAAGLLRGEPAMVSTRHVPVEHVSLGVSAGGAVATWIEPIGSEFSLRGVRIPAVGDVIGSRLEIAVGVEMPFVSVESAVAPDGTVTAAWPELDPTVAAATLRTRRFLPDGTATTTATLTERTVAGHVESFPVLAAAADGSVFVTSIQFQFGGDTTPLDLVARRIAADGTAGPAQVLGEASNTMVGSMPWVTIATAGSDATVGWYRGDPSPTFMTNVYDGTPPAVDARIPASVLVGEDARFSATATDPAGVGGFAWEFGDGSGASGASVGHVYARAGSYPITLTVADRAGNTTVVRRTLTVTAPVAPPQPPPPGPPGPPPPGPPAPAKATAALKLGTVARKGATVTVKGTIGPKASGRVTISWSAKVGRKTVVKRATAKIARGRFSVTLRLPRALARARGKATVKVVYGGDADTLAARAQRAVKAPKRAAVRR